MWERLLVLRFQNQGVPFITFLKKEKNKLVVREGSVRMPEEYLKPIGGGRKGGSYPDITAIKDGRTLRINTVDVNRSGVITTRELLNAQRIRLQTPGDHLILIPKK